MWVLSRVGRADGGRPQFAEKKSPTFLFPRVLRFVAPPGFPCGGALSLEGLLKGSEERVREPEARLEEEGSGRIHNTLHQNVCATGD